jgi:hypothetical protein
MTHLNGKIYTEKGKHRLHDRLNTLLIVSSSIGIASTYVIDGKVDLKTISFVTIECREYPTEIRLPFVGPLETALKDLEPDQIEIDFALEAAVMQSKKEPQRAWCWGQLLWCEGGSNPRRDYSLGDLCEDFVAQ